MVPKIINKAIMIVIYGRQVESVASYNILIDYAKNNKDCNIVFWNNGPHRVNYIPDSDNVFLCQTPENEKLSKIYNKFIESWKAETYLILDDDSVLSQYFLHRFDSMADCLGVATIYDNDQPCYPLIDGEVRIQDASYKINDSTLMSIGSGLVLQRLVVDRLKNEFGDVFDERFRIYGVDSSFYFRLMMLNWGEARFCVLPRINHCLSKNKEEVEAVKKFRARERSRDIALTLLYYRSSVNVARLILSVLWDVIKSASGAGRGLYDIRYLIRFLLDSKLRNGE